MGRLVQLEIENFKSYAGHQIIGPFKDFTAIIGPNGSGKSNLMDAISFVLGIQSRHLRSQQLKDLVFREDARAPARRKAMVKLVYRLNEGEFDNSKDGDEIHFQRVISASGGSSYMLNDVQSTWEEYDKVLKKIGVLTKARNFLVFQGDVESIAAKSPTELTDYFEQISGSDQFKSEYTKLKLQMEEAENQTIFSFQKKKGYQAERRQAQDEKQEAELFRQKCEELEEVKQQYFLLQLFHINKEMKVHDGKVAEHKALLAESQQHEDTVGAELKDKKKAHAKQNTVCQEAEKAMEKMRKQRDEVAPEAIKQTEEMKSLLKRQKNLGKEVKKHEAKAKEREDNLAGLEKDIQSLEEKEEQLEAEVQEASAKKGFVLDESKAEEYQELKAQARAQTADEQRELDALERQRAADKGALERREGERASYLNQIELDEKRLQEYIERKENMVKACKESEVTRKDLEQELKELRIRAKHDEARSQKIESNLEEINEKLKDARDDRRQSRREQKMAECLEILKRLFPGVRGRLQELCKPVNRKYNMAVTVAGGKLMEGIVVDRQRTAFECIQYMREQRIGTATFLPLDSIKTKPVEERLRALEPRNHYRLCLDIIECDEEIRPALLFAVGSTVVCNDLNDARELCFKRNEKVKAVTLSGAVISKAGLMTGGTTPSDADKASKWDEQEFAALKKQREELLQEKQDLNYEHRTRSRQTELETQIGGLKNKERYSGADLEYTENKITEQERNIFQLQKKVADIDSDKAKMEADSQNSDAQIASLKQRIEEVEHSIFQPFSEAVGVADIREYEEVQLAAVLKLNLQRTELREQKAKLESQLEYEKSRDNEKEIAKVKKKQSDTEKKIKDLEARQAKLEKKREAVAQAFTTAEEKFSLEKNLLEECDAELRTLQSEKEKAAKEKAKIGRKIANEEIQIERLRGKMHDVLQKSRVEEVDLSAKDGSREESETESESAGDEIIEIEFPDTMSVLSQGAASDANDSVRFSQPDHPAIQKDAATMLKIDFSKLKRYKEVKSAQHLEEVLREYVSEMNSIQSECEKMQPNMKAFEKYDNLTDRLKLSGKDFEKAKDHAQSAALAFNKIKTKRFDAFMECFNHVCENLNTTYRDLTKSSKHPLGGNAYLSLDDQEEPYLGGVKFNAMPPMKRFRDMDQLSGGEKTVASLALLFSVHSFRPAPFFVMDEVDAALDNINVKKVCNYVKQRSSDCQSLVISLKDMFYEKADSLVGICRDRSTNGSRSLTLDLEQYDG